MSRVLRSWIPRIRPSILSQFGLLAIICCMCGASVARADIDVYEGQFGSVIMSGFVEAEGDIHTAQRNPNNFAQPGNPEISLFQQWGLIDTTWQTPIEGFKFYARTRFFANDTANVDPGNIRHYDAFPQRFAGDGAAFMQLANDQVSLQGWEEWAQYQKGPLFVRIGKQTIVWGDVAPTRLLDDINPLDLSWHLTNEPLGKDVFDNLRIPIWAARASYQLPFLTQFGLQIEGYISPDVFAFVPTMYPAYQNVSAGKVGSPLNILGFPSIVNFTDNVRDGRRGASGGVRLLGKIGELGWSLNWLERHDAFFIPVVQHVVPPPPFGPGLLIDATGQHPRFDTVGASANYFEQKTGVVVRMETDWDIARPFENMTPLPVKGEPFVSAQNSEILRRDQYGYVVAFDRPTFLIPNAHHSASITFQFNGLVRQGGKYHLGQEGAAISKDEEQFSFLFEQPMEGWDWHGWNGRYDEWFFDYTVLCSLQNSAVMVPMVRWEPGNHWRFATWFNWYMGPNTNSTFTTGGYGAEAFTSGVSMSVSYLF